MSIEVLERALLNTLLGMGTVFVVLIFISLIIYCLGFIPKMMNKKNVAEVAPVIETPTLPEPAEAVEEELSDDLELVAVITAAVAAAAGTNPEGLVVRSIRRSKSNWKKA
ncbi:OadG family protein [Anaerolentibacter hominis]|uniref:OadG family protein n=1 Tax=Anaerolentibacter hominis TaxID=3079009 RepID=UPI0031B88277